MMRDFRSTILILAVLSASSVCEAKCYPEKTAPPDAECVVVARGPKRGIWFDLRKAEALRKLKLKAPKIELKLKEQASLIALQSGQIAGLRRVAKLREGSVGILQAVNSQLAKDLQAALEAERAAQEASSAWYRAPTLWFAAGIVATVGAGFATYAITR